MLWMGRALTGQPSDKGGFLLVELFERIMTKANQQFLYSRHGYIFWLASKVIKIYILITGKCFIYKVLIIKIIDFKYSI